jgi:hypothetical protein
MPPLPEAAIIALFSVAIPIQRFCRAWVGAICQIANEEPQEKKGEVGAEGFTSGHRSQYTSEDTPPLHLSVTDR